MANIIRKVKASVEAATSLPFIYGGAQEINVLLERATLPCAMAYLVDSSQILTEGQTMRERLTMAVFFINKTAFDPDSLENEDIIDTMKRKALTWLQVALQRQNTDGLRIGAAVNGQRIYDSFDTIVTGYGVTVTIDELDGVTQCETEEE